MASGRKKVRRVMPGDKTRSIGVEKLLALIRSEDKRKRISKHDPVALGEARLESQGGRVFVLRKGVKNILGAKDPTHAEINLEKNKPFKNAFFHFGNSGVPDKARKLRRRIL